MKFKPEPVVSLSRASATYVRNIMYGQFNWQPQKENKSSFVIKIKKSHFGNENLLKTRLSAIEWACQNGSFCTNESAKVVKNLFSSFNGEKEALILTL